MDMMTKYQFNIKYCRNSHQ